MKNNDFGFLFYLHFLIILALWSAPLWLGWQLILVGIAIYYMQLFFLGNCVLTALEFGEHKRDTTFYSYYLGKLGILVNKKKLSVFLDYVAPWLILVLALFYQVK